MPHPQVRRAPSWRRGDDGHRDRGDPCLARHGVVAGQRGAAGAVWHGHDGRSGRHRAARDGSWTRSPDRSPRRPGAARSGPEAVGKARFVGDGYKMFALGRAEGMGRRGTFGLRARIGHDHAIGILPALPGTGADARFPAGCRQARTRITRLGDLIHHPLALFPGGHASASLG